MIAQTLSKSFRHAALCVCLTLALLTVAIPARADNPPKFKDAEVTAFYQKVSDIFDGVLKALKEKDDAKVKALTADFMKVGEKGKEMDAKATPEELDASNKWIAGQMEKLTAAGWSPF